MNCGQSSLASVERFNLACRLCLHQDIADGRGFNRAGHDFFAQWRWRQTGSKSSFCIPPPTMCRTVNCLPGDIFNCFDDRAILKGQGLQYRPYHLSLVLRLSLALSRPDSHLFFSAYRPAQEIRCNQRQMRPAKGLAFWPSPSVRS